MLKRLIKFLMRRLPERERVFFSTEIYLFEHGFLRSERMLSDNTYPYFPPQCDVDSMGFQAQTFYSKAACLQALASRAVTDEVSPCDLPETTAEWNRHFHDDGWLTAGQILEPIGVKRFSSETEEVLKLITEHFPGTESLSPIYKPVTIEQIVMGEFFRPFIDSLPRGNSDFLMRCLTLPGATAVAVAHLIEQ